MTDPVVETVHGPVRGTWADGVHAFLGVPYAAPPVGPRRFQAPEPPAPWTEPRDATRPGATAPQLPLPGGMFPQTIIEGDDHLHVNVHTTDLDGARPVFVWIHGGGMVMGSNADVDGAALARRGLVVVAVNYRLGVDGFLCLDDAPPNRAVLDWVLALEWVQANVARFGGDPANVTIGGQSAGSAACLTLLEVPRAAGLFQRVVAMSGTTWNMVDVATARPYAAELATRLGTTPTTAGLAGVPMLELLAVQGEMAPVGGIGSLGDPLGLFAQVASLVGWMGPVVDGEVVAADPAQAAGTGAGAAAPLLIGSTAEEMDALLALFGATLTPADASGALVGLGLDPVAVDGWLAASPNRSPGAALGAALTALSFRLPALRLAEAREASPTVAAPTYVYEVTWRPPTPIGAVHGFDVPFAFDGLAGPGIEILTGGPPPQGLADDLAGAIVRFATDGDPGWPSYRPEDRVEMAFDVPSGVRHDAHAATRLLLAPLR